MDHYSLNTIFLKQFFFNSRTLINFRHSLKIWLPQDPWCSHKKQKNLPRAQCVPPWRIGLNEYLFIVKSLKYGWWVNRSVDWWSLIGGLVDKLFVVSGSVAGVFNKIPFFRHCLPPNFCKFRRNDLKFFKKVLSVELQTMCNNHDH